MNDVDTETEVVARPGAVLELEAWVLKLINPGPPFLGLTLEVACAVSNCYLSD